MDLPITAHRRVRWAYSASIEDFLIADPRTILGALVERSSADVTLLDRGAWTGQIVALQRELAGFRGRGSVYLEYDIPRLGKRVDTILVLDHALFVIEFKVGATAFDRAAINQVWDYALDLKYFHSASHLLPIVPVLVATESSAIRQLEHPSVEDGVVPPIGCAGSTLREALEMGLRLTSGNKIEPGDWEVGRYQPTPTIIEAARHLYLNHDVAEITRSDAGAENLSATTACVMQIIDAARAKREKVICFVTGVPGAGKTLVGLDVATKQSDGTDHSHSVFLSGNGPLVAVLQAALTHDEVKRASERGSKVTKGEAARKVKTFVQNVHHFRDEYLADKGPPRTTWHFLTKPSVLGTFRKRPRLCARKRASQTSTSRSQRF
ncbi:hypothetical protein LYSHEL_15150 [Lysobacter helvus]|uniref:Schlafen group 3-like DNA/RNA helicase domain-containing protein n=2 Tax=Lysobacteraceae TaxID=32033 RepID=A0ABN6FSM2_9GAMM|nr:hypothetical protein LYSCAS_15150 [Lysobacter caseinilyticus]BCT95644.1 hypothetical protein LYSHEL_15150 [Lysobacter helvus]